MPKLLPKYFRSDLFQPMPPNYCRPSGHWASPDVFSFAYRCHVEIRPTSTRCSPLQILTETEEICFGLIVLSLFNDTITEIRREQFSASLRSCASEGTLHPYALASVDLAGDLGSVFVKQRSSSDHFRRIISFPATLTAGTATNNLGKLLGSFLV